jgi:hypothetical protein
MPKKNKQNSTTSNLINGIRGKDDDDDTSISSISTMGTMATESSMKNLTVKDHRRSASALSLGRASPRNSVDGRSENTRPATPGTPGLDGQVKPRRKHNISLANLRKTTTLFRENQRISLRAFLRTLLGQPQIAQTKAMQEFLTLEPLTPSDADVIDISQRKAMDDKRVEEQKQFYEVARKRAAELDVYMEQ